LLDHLFDMARCCGPDRPLDSCEKRNPAGGSIVRSLAECRSCSRHQRHGRNCKAAKPLAYWHIRLLKPSIRQLMAHNNGGERCENRLDQASEHR
jgi:hypothetical protein